MKKIIFAIAIVMTLGLSASAQRGMDGFFTYDDMSGGRNVDLPALPNTGIGDPGDVTAPLGSGLLVLTALGVGYALRKKKNNE